MFNVIHRVTSALVNLVRESLFHFSFAAVVVVVVSIRNNIIIKSCAWHDSVNFISYHSFKSKWNVPSSQSCKEKRKKAKVFFFLSVEALTDTLAAAGNNLLFLRTLHLSSFLIYVEMTDQTTWNIFAGLHVVQSPT